MIATLTLQEIEKASRKLTLSRTLLLTIRGDFEGFKNLLKQVSGSLDSSIQSLNADLNDIEIDELEKLHLKYKKFSKFYDKLNDKYFSENYFNDPDIKILFRNISKNFHKLENISYKHLIQDNQVEPAPDYLKEGISQVSRNVVGEKLIIK